MSPLPASVLDHIAAGRKIAAIKEVRALTGLGLREAKDIVEQAERGEAVSLNFSQGMNRSAVTPDELAARISGLVADGRKIEAINELRSATGLGLKDAKQLVERVAAGQPLGAPPMRQPLQQPAPSRSAALIVIAAGLLALLGILVALLMAA